MFPLHYVMKMAGVKCRLHPAGIILFWMAMLLGGNPAKALNPADLSFYAPFDDSLNAASAAGDAKPQKAVGQYEFAPGVLGKSVIAGEKGKELAYGVTGNFPDQEGTISMWVKTVDWKAGDFQDHLLAHIPERLLFYHCKHSSGIHLEWPNLGGITYAYPPGLNQEKWVHLAYTWGKGKVVAYGNGQFVSKVGLNQPPYFPASLQELPRWVEDLQFHIGDPSMTKDGKNKTLVDELMVFNRPLDATEVKSLYRRVAAPLPETIVRIGAVGRAPTADGIFKAEEWKQTAQLADFVDQPFGNLSQKPVKANLAFDQKALYLAVRGPEGNRTDPEKNSLEVWLCPKDAKDPYRFLVASNQKCFVHRGLEAAKEGIPWQAAVSTPTGKNDAESCFEIAIPWSSIGLANPPEGGSLKMNILRRWSTDYGNLASWVDATPSNACLDPARYGTILFGGKSPVLSMNSLGKLNYAQLELDGQIINPPANELDLKAEVRLQPSDLKEYYDPKTLPGTKSYTGTRLMLDRELKLKGESADLRVTETFSETDINSLWLKVTDPAGAIIYQAQRPFIAQPPVVVILKTYADHDRLELCADVSCYQEAPLGTLRADIELIAPSGKVVNTARIDKFASRQEMVNLPLAPLPVGTIKVKATLYKDRTKISEFTASFEKIAPGPWHGNKLGKEDIVMPPFTPIKVKGQMVSMWGRTYKWDNSLFPVQITSAGEDLLAEPMELLAGDAPTGKPNPARVKVVEQKTTRTVVECSGEIDGIPITARHRIEYDGMCLTQIQLNPKEETEMSGLSLHIPYKREQSTLYMLWPDTAAGAVTEEVNYACLPMKGGRDFNMQNVVWLGNEDRGMSWFSEDTQGWQLKGAPAPMTVLAEGSTTSFTIRFAGKPFNIDKPLSLAFGIMATPVKPMPEGWRFLRAGRDWQYYWFEGFTASNNDIANPDPLCRYNYAKFRLLDPKFLPYRDYEKPMPCMLPYQFPGIINTRQTEAAYYGEEWLLPPRSIVGNDNGSDHRHLSVCLGSGFQDFLVYYAMKAYRDQLLDGYYFDGGPAAMCANMLHGHGWKNEDGAMMPTATLLANREYYRRIAAECSKSGRPYRIFLNINPAIVMPSLSFVDMGWNGEQFSTQAVPKRDYTQLMTLPYFRTQFLGQQFGMVVQWLVMFTDPSIGKKEIDSVLALALVHGTGDLIMASSLGDVQNTPYCRNVLDAQEAFGIRRKDARFLPYWNNQRFVTVDPVNENLVCSLWQRAGKVLLALANVTQEDRDLTVRLDVKALGLENALTAADLITKEKVGIVSGTVTIRVPRAGWRLIAVEPASGKPPPVGADDPPNEMLHAAARGDLARVKDLLAGDRGLRDVKDADGYTPLHLAAYGGRTEVVQFLLQSGADANVRCRFGFTPLHCAANDCFTSTVAALLAGGADVNARENNQIVPLHFAVSTPINGKVPPGYVETVTLLLDKGAQVNACDGFGRTALHWLVNWHPCSMEPRMAELLISRGADVNARDVKEHTPLWWATTPHYFKDPLHPALAEVFRKHGGKE